MMILMIECSKRGSCAPTRGNKIGTRAGSPSGWGECPDAPRFAPGGGQTDLQWYIWAFRPMRLFCSSCLYSVRILQKVWRKHRHTMPWQRQLN